MQIKSLWLGWLTDVLPVTGLRPAQVLLASQLLSTPGHGYCEACVDATSVLVDGHAS